MDFDALEANGRKTFPARLVWLIPYLLLAAVALFWPAQGALLGFDFRASWWVEQVPSMAAYIRKSSFASATAAYLGLSAVLFLPTFLVALVKPWWLFGGSKALRRYSRRVVQRPVLLPLTTVVISALAIWGAWIQSGHQLAILPLNDRRWALAICGPLFAFPPLFYYLVSSAAFAVRLLFVVVEEFKNGME